MRQYRGVCLITGCVRSGTTAMQEWLSQSKETAVFNESRISNAACVFLDYVYNNSALYSNRQHIKELLKTLICSYVTRVQPIRNKIIVFKEPLPNAYCHFLIGLNNIFPDLRIIFMVRHPVNVINSMLKRKWGYSLRKCNPSEISPDTAIKWWKMSAYYYTEYKYKNIYLCKFEDLINNPRNESRKLLQFLGLKGLPAFIPHATKVLDLDNSITQNILRETRMERKLFGYKQ